MSDDKDSKKQRLSSTESLASTSHSNTDDTLSAPALKPSRPDTNKNTLDAEDITQLAEDIPVEHSEQEEAGKRQQPLNKRSRPEPLVSEEAFTQLFERVGSAAGQAFNLAKRTTGTSYKVGKALIQSQDQLKLMVSAGQSLKDLREVAGLTVSELSEAIQLKDKSILEAVENGTATLSFELILRLSALLARNDPIPFILKYSRTYSPDTWKLLHDWGAGRLPLQYQREREFINIYRSKDEARELSDESFAQVLAFTREAFNTALHFAYTQEQRFNSSKKDGK